METFAVGFRNSKSQAKGYALAAAAALAAVLVRSLMTPLLGDQTPYLAAWAAVVFSAWYCGLGPSIVTVLLSLLGVLFFVLPPTHTFRLMYSKSELTGNGWVSGFFRLYRRLGGSKPKIADKIGARSSRQT